MDPEPVKVSASSFRDMMVKNVFPTIRKEFYHTKHSGVIELDGAKPHWAASIQQDIYAKCKVDGSKVAAKK